MHYLSQEGHHFFCPLGRACEVALEYGVGMHIEREGLDYVYDGYASSLPPQVQHWYGFTTPLISWPGGSIAWMNDDGVPFRELADIIESEPEGLC